MVDAVRTTEKALGEPRFGPSQDELPSMVFRRSLFVARDVRAGSVLTCDDVRSVRPSNGLPPHALPAILGRTATRDLSAATPLTWDAVGVAPSSHTVQLRAARADDALGPEYLVAEANGAVVGNVRLEPTTAGTCDISVTIAPASRRRGYATPVLLAAEDAARARGVRTLTATLATTNEPAVRALKKAGYYGFADRTTTNGTVIVCERRIAPYF
jgi:L-amino acid N-acyltransferase YncA